MSKLSHIEDIERRAQQTVTQTVAPEPEAAVPEQPVSEQGDMSAEQEEEFHGLDTTPPMGTGHKTLIVVAVVVVIVAILYIVNSWVHFV